MESPKWQDNYQEVMHNPHAPHTKASAMFINEDEVEIRIVQRFYGHKDGKYLYSVYYGEDKCWHKLEENAYVPVYKIWDAKKMIEAGVLEPLQEGVHVRDPCRDACLRCGLPGQWAALDEKEGTYTPCPGWISPRPFD